MSKKSTNLVESIKYRKGYKYQLHEDYIYSLDFDVPIDETQPFVQLQANNIMIIKEGYAWDGTSGGVPDTKRNLRASLIHDALYQLIRHQILDFKTHRDKSDRLFQKVCVKDGVWRFIAYTYYMGLKMFGGKAASHKSKKPILQAPK